MAIRTFKTLNKVAVGGIPNADALVERPGGDILSVGRDSNGGDAIFNAEDQDVLTRFDVPEANGAVTAARCDGSTIASKV